MFVYFCQQTLMFVAYHRWGTSQGQRRPGSRPRSLYYLNCGEHYVKPEQMGDALDSAAYGAVRLLRPTLRGDVLYQHAFKAYETGKRGVSRPTS